MQGEAAQKGFYVKRHLLLGLGTSCLIGTAYFLGLVLIHKLGAGAEVVWAWKLGFLACFLLEFGRLGKQIGGDFKFLLEKEAQENVPLSLIRIIWGLVISVLFLWLFVSSLVVLAVGLYFS